MPALLRITGAIAYLAVVFLNAFVDIAHKTVIQSTVFKVYDDPIQTTLLAIVNALILLPFILLFSPAGFVGDRYPKASVIRATSLAALALALAVTACYYLGWFEAAFAMTFLLAAQSAFYSPAKYGYLKHLFGNDHLGAANGAVQAVTIVAILAGALVFAAIFEASFDAGLDAGLGAGFDGTGAGGDASALLTSVAPLGWLLVLSALGQVVLAFRLPDLEPGDPTQTFDWPRYRRARLLQENIQRLRGRSVIQLSILGLAIFW